MNLYETLTGGGAPLGVGVMGPVPLETNAERDDICRILKLRNVDTFRSREI